MANDLAITRAAVPRRLDRRTEILLAEANREFVRSRLGLAPQPSTAALKAVHRYSEQLRQRVATIAEQNGLRVPDDVVLEARIGRELVGALRATPPLENIVEMCGPTGDPPPGSDAALRWLLQWVVLSQISVTKDRRRQGIGLSLLKRLHAELVLDEEREFPLAVTALASSDASQSLFREAGYEIAERQRSPRVLREVLGVSLSWDQLTGDPDRHRWVGLTLHTS